MIEKNPAIKELEAAREIATTAESAQYLAVRSREKFKKSKKLDYFSDTITSFEQHARYKQLERENRPSAFESKDGYVPSDFENYYRNVAQETAVSLKEDYRGSTVKMHFAMNEDAKIRRAFSMDGAIINEKDTVLFDDIFNAWLVKNGFICIDSTLYIADKEHPDQPALNDKGRPMKVPKEQLMPLVTDKDKGPQALFPEQLTFAVKERAYPEQAKVAPTEARKATVTTAEVEAPKTPSGPNM